MEQPHHPTSLFEEHWNTAELLRDTGPATFEESAWFLD